MFSCTTHTHSTTCRHLSTCVLLDQLVQQPDRQMQILLDTDHEDPLFSQLIRQVKQAVRDGQLTPQTQLPSIRQLAGDLGIHQNTVAKAYKLLERDQVIISKGYRGTFVHPDAQQNCLTDHSQAGRQLLTDAIGQLRALGLTDSEIRLLFADVLKNQSPPEL